MPRRGKGQQAVQTTTGQAYGEAQVQEEAQAIVPLPEDVMKPGEMAFSRPSEMPSQSIFTESPMPSVETRKDPAMQAKAASILPVLEAMASMPGADPAIRNMARINRQLVGDMSEVGVPIIVSEDQ